MNSRVLLFLMVMFWVFSSCSTEVKKPKEQPKNENVDVIFDYLNTVFSPEKKEQFRTKDLELTSDDYFMIRQYAKAQLLTEKEVLAHFEKNNMGDLDVLPRALAKCYELHLQDKFYNLEKRYETIADDIIPKRECHKILKARAKEYFNTYDIGDTISIKAPFYHHDTGYAVDIIEEFCKGREWNFNIDEDELYYGIIKDKISFKSGNQYKFSVYIFNMNNNFNQRNGNTIRLTEEVEFTLNSPILIEPLTKLTE